MSATDEPLLVLAPPPKFSRPFSARRRSTSEARPDVRVSVFEDDEEKALEAISIMGGPARNLSLRRRSKTVTSADQSYQPSTPPVPALSPDILAAHAKSSKLAPSDNFHFPSRKDSNASEAAKMVGYPRPIIFKSESAIQIATVITAGSFVKAHQVESPRSVRSRREAPSPRDDQISRFREREEEEEATRWAEEVSRLEAETDRVLAFNDKKMEEATRPQQIMFPTPPPSPFSLRPRSPLLEKLNFLSRTRRSNGLTMSPTSSLGMSSVDVSSISSLEPVMTPQSEIEPIPKVINVQLKDSPLPVSSPGERFVTVRCRGASMSLPITKGTTAGDILLDCSEQLTHPINTATSNVIEVYGRLGLERRVRRYETVQDIVSSWDHDKQHWLAVQPEHVKGPMDIDIVNVPRAGPPPKGFVMSLYHSQRPGKWNKCYVTLLEGGQLFSSKRPDPNPTDKDVVGLCHLSEFDIYTVTESQTRKNLKPPKKYCYAIKSQEKSTTFIKQDRFVHFFCTNDPNVAHHFHSIVHGWRSWYLASKVLSEKQKKSIEEAMNTTIAPVPPRIRSVRHKPVKSISHLKVNGHKVKVSIDESPYAIGAFVPLLDLDRFAKPLEEFGNDWIPDVPEMPKRPAMLDRSQSAEPTFAQQGLLGEEYDERKQEQTDHQRKLKDLGLDLAAAVGDSPFTDAPTLLSGGLPHTAPCTPTVTEAKSWFPSAQEHSAREQFQQRETAKALRRNLMQRHPPLPPLPMFPMTPISRPSTSSGFLSPQDHEQHSRRWRGGGPHPAARAPIGLARTTTTRDASPTPHSDAGGHGLGIAIGTRAAPASPGGIAANPFGPSFEATAPPPLPRSARPAPAGRWEELHARAVGRPAASDGRPKTAIAASATTAANVGLASPPPHGDYFGLRGMDFPVPPRSPVWNMPAWGEENRPSSSGGGGVGYLRPSPSSPVLGGWRFVETR